MDQREVYTMIKDKVYRMLDANINRSTEGLRVTEDIVRFVLDDHRLTARLKNVRHTIAGLVVRMGASKRVTLIERDVRRDVGAKRTTRSESKRTDIHDVFTANIKRAEESIRVFEETSKLFGPKLAPKFKKVRFELYDIEQKASILLKKKIKLDSPLYVITDDSFGYSHLNIMKQASQAGARIFQLRDKGKGIRDKVRIAKQMARYAKAHGLTFIVNDDPDIALRSKADGVHVGLREAGMKGYRLGIEGLREKGKIIGISASNVREALRAQKLGADYIGFGPVFKTLIKPDAKPTGINELKRVIKRVKIPVVAIGGVCFRTMGQVMASGAASGAVIRYVSASTNIKRAVKGLLKLAEAKRP